MNAEPVRTFLDALSNREITLLAAIVSAVVSGIVSIFTTRYSLKHGPNYEGQIEGLHETIGSLARTQEELRKQQAEQAHQESERYAAQEQRAEAERWKPGAVIEGKVEGNEFTNKLILKSTDSFRILEVSLVSVSGAKIDDLALKDSWVDSTGFGIQIPGSLINKLAEISPTFFKEETFEGKLRFKVQRVKDGASFTGDIPFHGSRTQVGNNGFYVLRG